MSEHNDVAGRRARRARRYSVAEKRAIVQYAQTHSVTTACRHYNVARSTIYLWVGEEDAFSHTVDQGESPSSPGVVRELEDQASYIPPPNRSTMDAGVNHEEAPMIVSQSPASGVLHDEGSATNIQQQDESRREVTVDDDHQKPRSPPPATVVDGEAGNFLTRFYDVALEQALPVGAFELTGFPQVSRVIDALHNDEIDYAFIATDVLMSNVHHSALDRLVASPLKIVGEVVSQEEVSVCALPGTEICDVLCIVSDWPTLQRYEEYIVHLEMQYNKPIYRQVVWDSALGCGIVLEEEAKDTLVLCSSSAAAAHGLVVLQDRVLGSSTHSRYTILGRRGTPSVEFETPINPAARRSTVLVRCAARAILDVVSAFVYRGLEITALHVQTECNEHEVRSYAITYVMNPVLDSGLQLHLLNAAERVISLGNYMTYML